MKNKFLSARTIELDSVRRELLQLLATTTLSACVPIVAIAAIDANVEDIKRKQPLKSFSLEDVRLLDGPFKTAQQLNSAYLLSLDADRLLHNFHVNAGLDAKAPIYGGWESQQPWVDIRCHGHTLGHYLSACAMMVAATDDPQFKQRVHYIVSELARCQKASVGGMVCAFPDGTTQLENSLNAQPFIGVPWYTTHKVMSGLRDAYLFAHNAQALEVLRGMAEWIIQSSASLSEKQFQDMLRVEHGGMNEVLADLFVLTQDKRYLHLAQRFNHLAVLQPLSEAHDALDGLHSNTQIPKVIGFARQYQLTGNETYSRAATFFWQTVVTQRSFATGGNGDGEHFFPPSDFKQHLSSAKTMETCCTHNMLKLSRELFATAPDIAYVDYYERALFNSILASQDPQSGMMTYFQPTRPGYLKLYCTPTESFWCCTGTGMENHAKYGDSIYYHDDDSLFINLFVASELYWRAKNVRVIQTTTFPDQAQSRFTLKLNAPRRFSLNIRHPAWCHRLTLKVNGRVHVISSKSGTYVNINRIWRDGDILEAMFPMQLHLEPLPHSKDIAALMIGPIVLAARLGTEGIQPGADLIINERTYGDMMNIPMDLPQLHIGANALDKHIQRLSQDALAFKVSMSSLGELELIPYYRIAHERYNLYWQVV